MKRKHALSYCQPNNWIFWSIPMTYRVFRPYVQHHSLLCFQWSRKVLVNWSVAVINCLSECFLYISCSAVHENEDVHTSPDIIEPTIYVYIYLYVWIFQTPMYYHTHRSEYHQNYRYLIRFIQCCLISLFVLKLLVCKHFSKWY